MEQFILSPFALEQIVEAFQDLLREELKATRTEELREKFLSPKETCRLFTPSISLVTLASRTSKGLLTKHYIGGRTYYKYSEILASIKSLKKYSLNEK